MSVEQYLEMTGEAATDRVLARARRYVDVETPSGDAPAIRELAALVRADLEACGADVETFEVPDHGANLLAELAGGSDASEPVLVLAHIDTVHPVGSVAERPFRIEGGRAFAPGIYDMKTGLALVIEALTWLHERGQRPRRPVQLLVTCDEEIGSDSARPLIVQLAPAAAAVLVPEPCLSDGGAKTARKGVATYRIETDGVAAHAGIEGESAVSAIAALVHALEEAMSLADHSRGTTVNIGCIGGGTASNVIAGRAWAIVDVRIAEPPEGERVHDALMALRPHHERAGIRVERTEDRPPLVRSTAVVNLYEQARGLAAALGVELTEGSSGGGSDGSIAAAAGGTVLDGLGCLGGGAHAVDEHIVIADLPFRLAFMIRLLEAL